MERAYAVTTTALAPVGKLAAKLATTESLAEVIAFRNQASALKDAYAKVHDALEKLNDWAELKILAERRAGELLLEGPRNRGGRPPEKTGPTVRPVLPEMTYGELGIDKRQAWRWQAMARIPDEVLNRHIAAVKDAGKELTTQGVLLLARSFNPAKANRPGRSTGTASMTPEEIEALRSENRQTMTVSVETVAVCGRQVIITEGRGSLLLNCPSKRKASMLAFALREALPKKLIRIELFPRGNNVTEDGEGSIAQERPLAAKLVKATVGPVVEHGKSGVNVDPRSTPLHSVTLSQESLLMMTDPSHR